MKDKLCQIKYQEPLGGDYYRIGLLTGYESFIPGQFGMVEVPPLEGVLLRRPFSFARQEGEVTEILYKVVGKGTLALSRAAVGQSLRVLGPLGRGFSLPADDGEWVGVAGGYGVAPFLELGKQMKRRGQELHLFYGARRMEDLLYLEELASIGVQIHLATEDGSEGYRGLVTESLEQVYLEKKPDGLFACGPMGLLKALQEWSRDKGIEAQLSVEEAMGCGTGVCLGCVVESGKGGYLRACIEGPVFSGKEIRI